jgi:glucosyl-dolichyl phosphate glucuronosyltransferase
MEASFSPFELGISVIICAYTEKRWDYLLAAVESVRTQTVSPKEIIVVIDHNQALFQRASSSIESAIVIENHEARGLSGARNCGIAIAKGDILAFMDEDATAEPSWLENLSKPYQTPTVMGVGGMIVPVWLNGRPAWFPEEFNWVVGCTYKGVSEQAAPIRNLIGCNMSFRSDVFASVGGFRSGIGRIGTLPFGCEETELCIRTTQKFPLGQFIHVPAARVTHRVPAERGRFLYFRSRCYAEGISKSLVTLLVGGVDGLSSERTYTFRTLPAGVLRGFWDVLRHGDFSGFGRAGAIVLGLAITTWGYLAGKLSKSTMTNQLVTEPVAKL